MPPGYRLDPAPRRPGRGVAKPRGIVPAMVENDQPSFSGPGDRDTRIY